MLRQHYLFNRFMNANVLVAKKWHISFFSERQAAREHFRLSFTQTYVLAIMMIALLGVYYVWILNQNATKGYNIRTLQTEYRELSFQENLLQYGYREDSLGMRVSWTLIPRESSRYPYCRREVYRCHHAVSYYFGDAGSRQANISRDARCTIYDEGVEYLN